MTLSDDDDLIAAEYALGTLDGAERDAAERRRAVDPLFAQAVDDWELRLAPLSEAGREAEPPDQMWERILARIEGLSSTSTTVVPLAQRADRLRRQVDRWRTAAAAMTALAASLALWIAQGEMRAPRVSTLSLVAFLQKSGDEPAFVIGVDPGGEALSVRPIAARTPAGHSYELWIIDPQLGAPRSLGVVDGPVSSHNLPSDIPRDVLSRATYAVTVEPPGGSATGSPSGAPVFLGRLVDAPR